MEKKENFDDLISISEAARIRGVSHAAIQDLLKREKLSSVEIGGRRFLSRSEVESYQAEPKTGRPSKKTSDQNSKVVVKKKSSKK